MSTVTIESVGATECTGKFHALVDVHCAKADMDRMFHVWIRQIYLNWDITRTSWSYNGIDIVYDGTFHCKNGSPRIPINRFKSKLGPEFIYVVATSQEEATRLVQNVYLPEHLPPTLDWVPFRKEFPDLEWGKTYDLSQPMPVVVDVGYRLKWGREIG